MAKLKITTHTQKYWKIYLKTKFGSPKTNKQCCKNPALTSCVFYFSSIILFKWSFVAHLHLMKCKVLAFGPFGDVLCCQWVSCKLEIVGYKIKVSTRTSFRRQNRRERRHTAQHWGLARCIIIKGNATLARTVVWRLEHSKTSATFPISPLASHDQWRFTASICRHKLCDFGKKFS
jgi:hypothetical protein